MKPEESWREACAAEMLKFVHAMKCAPGVWRNGINRGEPEDANDMPKFVKNLGVWGGNFELALIASRLDIHRGGGGGGGGDENQSGRLIVLAADVFTKDRFSICLPPNADLLDGEKFENLKEKSGGRGGGETWSRILAPRNAIDPRDITEDDEIIVNIGVCVYIHIIYTVCTYICIYVCMYVCMYHRFKCGASNAASGL